MGLFIEFEEMIKYNCYSVTGGKRPEKNIKERAADVREWIKGEISKFKESGGKKGCYHMR